MAKRSGRRKHVPKRMCVACRAVGSKRDLVRIVRTPDGSVVVDERGKRNGRGAYLCATRSCWDMALEKRRLSEALKVELQTGDLEGLRTYAAGLLDDVDGSGEG